MTGVGLRSRPSLIRPRKSELSQESGACFMLRLVNFSHPARANLGDDFVGAETRAIRNCHHRFPAAEFCFNSSVQFSTTLISSCACSLAFKNRNRWLSAVTS
jgi:hypothetical protein